MIKILFLLSVCQFLQIRGTEIWRDTFTDICESRQEQELEPLDDWAALMQQSTGIADTLSGGSQTRIGCFTTDYYPGQVPDGLTFIQLYGSCISRKVDGLTADTYKLSFNFYQDYRTESSPQSLIIYIVEDGSYTPIAEGTITMTLRDKIYLYKKINFQLTSVIDIYIVFCDTSGNDITGITNIQLATWPPIDCTGKVKKQDMNSDPFCVQTQTVTNSIDCFLFSSETECGACDQLTQDIDLVDLDTPAKGCIQRSNLNYDTHCSLYSYSTNFQCETCTYITGETFDALKVFTGNTLYYKCPTKPSLKQAHCTEYLSIGMYISCKTCPYTLLPGANSTMICVRDIIPKCKFYLPDATCDPCGSGIPSVGLICPSNAVSYFPNCLRANKIGTVYTCIACLKGYVLNFQNECLKMVMFCSNYRLNLCVLCIRNYILFEGNCYKQITQCKVYDLNGRCNNCSQGFFATRDGICTQQIKIVCKQTQYIRDGKCVLGTIQHCIKYQPATGNCETCKEGYRLRDQNRCEIICPNDSKFQRWIVKNGFCFKEDLRCNNARPDGYCYDCKDGFYAFYGICYQININF